MWKRQLLQTEDKQNYKISKICFREIKTIRHHQCLQSRNHCSQQWFHEFLCLLEDFFCLFVSRFIFTTAYPSPFFRSDLLMFGFYFVIYLAMVLSVRSIRRFFSTFPVLISSNNSFGKFSPVKFTFCVFSFGKNIFLKFWFFKHDMLATSNHKIKRK